MADDPAYTRFTRICLALPETKVTITWGEPHLRVRDKIFTGWSLDDGGRSWSFGVKLDKDQQAAMVASDPRFTIAPYTGKHGGVSIRIVKGEEDWDEIAALVEQGYRNVAPKAVLAKLDAAGAAAAKPAATKRSPVKAAPAKKSPAKKSPAKKSPAKQSPPKKSPRKKPR